MIVLPAKWSYLDKSGCIQEKVVVFGQKWLYSGKVIVLGQNRCVREKVVVIG